MCELDPIPPKPVIGIKARNKNHFESWCAEMIDRHYEMNSSGVYLGPTSRGDVWWAVFVHKPESKEEK